MKKPSSKPNHQPGKKPSGSLNDKNLGKALDVAKQGLAAVDSVAGVFKEKERTHQTVAQAQADVQKAQEETSRCRIGAQKRRDELMAEDRKDARAHEHAMAALADQRVKDASIIRAREQMLDRLLNDPMANGPELIQSLALLSKPDGD